MIGEMPFWVQKPTKNLNERFPSLERLWRHEPDDRLTRKETREALGVDDVRLTQPMRRAGFPPPRSPKAEEDAQVEFS